MNKEVKTIKKNKNDEDSKLDIQTENNNQHNIKSKKIFRSKSIKLDENNDIKISNIKEKKESKPILLDMKETKKNNLGQFFTTDKSLQKKLYEFILNKPKLILEPSIGAGDLINFVLSKSPKIIFDMYEIDTNIDFLNTINKKNIIFGDFLKKKINKTYDTIIGNPPYVKTSKGNLYIDFIEKCYN